MTLRIALLLALLGGGSASAATLGEWAEWLDQPRISGPLESPTPLRVGRGALAPRPGTKLRLLLAGDVPCGLFVDGPAAFSYRVEDRFSQPVAERNLRRASSLEPQRRDGALVVATEVEWALVWSFELAAGVEPPPTQAPPALPAAAQALLANALFQRPAVELLVARHLPAPGLAYALLHGAREDLVLEVDPTLSREERLYTLVRVRRDEAPVYAGRYFPRELAAQPIGRQWWDQFPAPVVVTHEALEVVNDQGAHVRITSRLRLQGMAAASGLFHARLWDATLEATREHPIRVLSVAVAGGPVDFLHRDSQLLVPLEPPLGAGQSVEVEVVHEGAYALRYGGDAFWSLGTWPWYPKPLLNGELATVELTVRVPPPFSPIASGETVARETADGFNVLRTRLDKPMSFPVVAAGKYHFFDQAHGGITARVATYAQADERGARRLLNNFFAAEECYRQKLNAEFPFREITVVELNDWGYGQAPPGVIFITGEAFNTLLDPTARAFSEGVNERYLHEIAHAYWAHALKFPSLDENWLSESFASYSAALCLDALSGKGSEFKMEGFVRRWRADTEELGAGVSIYLAERLAGKGFQDVADRRTLLYSKGPLVLHALRLELQQRAGSVAEGDRQFLILLRSFLKNFPYQWGSTVGFTGILNQLTGSDWQPWFERYLYGTETPQVK